MKLFFVADVLILVVLLIGTVWSVAYPAKRIWPHNFRLIVGIPLALVGALLVSWGLATLGARNSSGLKGGFVSSGPYRFTRNPQYLGDMILFVGLSVIANSLYLWITHGLLIIVFAVIPLAEEPWLKAQYGEPYIKYKRGSSRFL